MRPAGKSRTKVALVAALVFAIGTVTPIVSANRTPATTACMTSSGRWVNSTLPQAETGIFRLEFDATPSSTGIDGVVGLSSGPAGAYTSLAAIVRFNTTGTIDAMNGANYTAATAVAYTAGTTYHFILDVNVTAHTYNASVVVNGASVAIGTKLAFRNEQAGVSSLSNIGSMTSSGSQTVCNVAVSSPSSTCLSSSGSWVNSALPQAETGTFRLEFDATPSSTGIDGIVGLSSGPAGDYSNLAAIVRFNSTGTIDARNGGAYTASAAIPYSGGTSYHFILDVNLTAHTYNASVLVNGAHVVIGTKLAFRAEQAGVSSLNNIASMTSSGSQTVCNVVVTSLAGCTISSASWMNSALPQAETGTFRVEFDATPSSTGIDGVVGLSSGPAGNYSNVAAMVRFNSTGTIDARNGTAYTAASPIAYSAGTPYHFILDVNLTADTYNASVLVNGAQVVIGTKLAFRAEQAGVSSLNNIASITTLGSEVICNVAVSAATVAPMVPSITTQPLSQTVTSGQTATFSAAGTGTAPMSYQWQKNGAAISGAIASTYQTPATTVSDSGSQFAVVMSNSAGSVTSSGATLTVKPPAVAPSITAQPLSQTVTSGQTATFTVAGTGTAPMSYQWQKNGTAISGATASTYQTPVTTVSDSGSQFAVVMSNSAGNVTSNPATLTVTSAGCIVSSATWVNSALLQAETGMFRLEFDATPSSTGIDGVVGLSSGPADDYSNLAAIVRFNSTGTIDARNGGAYTASAAIPYSGGTSYHFILDVNLTGQTYNASVVVNGAQTVIGTSLAFRSEQAGITSLSNLAAEATLGSQTICNVKVSAVAPSITTQPLSQTVTPGQAATFSVAGTGTAPMSYQWQKNGTAISGATSSTYQTPAATVSDNGSQFTVVLSNSAGSVTSGSGTLTVSTGTFLLAANPAQLSFGSVNVSSNNVQNIMVANSGTSNITISGVAVSGAGFNAGGGIAGLILSPGQSAPLSVTFAPASAGSVSGSVTVKSNATNSPITIALTGTGVAQAHSVNLNWSASTSSVIGYNIYSSRVSGGPYVRLNPTPMASTSYTDATVQSGQTYYYVTTAVGSGSASPESGFSSEVSAVIP